MKTRLCVARLKDGWARWIERQFIEPADKEGLLARKVATEAPANVLVELTEDLPMRETRLLCRAARALKHWHPDPDRALVTYHPEEEGPTALYRIAPLTPGKVDLALRRGATGLMDLAREVRANSKNAGWVHRDFHARYLRALLRMQRSGKVSTGEAAWAIGQLYPVNFAPAVKFPSEADGRPRTLTRRELRYLVVAAKQKNAFGDAARKVLPSLLVSRVGMLFNSLHMMPRDKQAGDLNRIVRHGRFKGQVEGLEAWALLDVAREKVRNDETLGELARTMLREGARRDEVLLDKGKSAKLWKALGDASRNDLETLLVLGHGPALEKVRRALAITPAEEADVLLREVEKTGSEELVRVLIDRVTEGVIPADALRGERLAKILATPSEGVRRQALERVVGKRSMRLVRSPGTTGRIRPGKTRSGTKADAVPGWWRPRLARGAP